MTERPPRATCLWSALFIAAYAQPRLARQLATDLWPPVSKNRRPATRHDVGRVLATREAYSRPAHRQKATTPRRTQERQT
ncbi:hypothetical protein ABZ741_38865 [Streptomyces globisporus]|uniref:hypothetical protein n=1 Tax=Streptomyces globisporus TaxID=1908 RepID=UPI00346022CE